MRNKPSWSEKAINEFEKIYSSGELLKFRCYCNVAEQHVYGSLDVLLSSGKSVNMDDALKKIDEAMDTENFETGSDAFFVLFSQHLERGAFHFKCGHKCISTVYSLGSHWHVSKHRGNRFYT